MAEKRFEYASTGLMIEVDPMHRHSVNDTNSSIAPRTTTNLSLFLLLLL